MKIATWNVNSLNVRLGHVLKWMDSEKPDILALQEIKMETARFPEIDFYTAVSGQKTYNGVALLSKFPLEDIETPDYNEQKRIIAATVNNIRIINIYVPNGEAVGSAKYEFKLNWLSYLKKYLLEALKKYPQLIVLGDFNIAPEDQDVHDPEAWRNKVLFSQPEKEALQDIIELGFLDSFRLFPQQPKSYTWWDYRMLGFRRNAGLRIDHILISKALEKACLNCQIDKEPRRWEKPSDHAPVLMELAAC